MRNQKVFISHGPSDAGWVARFAEALKHKHGVSAWVASLDISPGQSVREMVGKALRGSSVVVLLINRDNANEPNLFFELGAASAMGKTIIPVVSEDVPSSELPLPLRNIQILVRTTPEETAERFVAALGVKRGEAA